MQAVPPHAVPAGPLASAGSPTSSRPRRPARSRQRDGRARERRRRHLARGPRSRTTGWTSSATRSTGTACARRSRASSRASAPRSRPGVRAPMPPGRYRLAFDLVVEDLCWLSEIGNELLATDVDVGPRDADDAVAHLPPGRRAGSGLARARPGRARGGVRRGRRRDREPRARAARPTGPGGGRNPSFAEPLVCPSLLPPLEPNCEVAGLPAWRRRATSRGSTTADRAR